MRTNYWTFTKKIKFILSYFFYKLGLAFEVKEPKREFLKFELSYSVTNLINTLRPGRLSPVMYRGPHLVSTTSGSFFVRDGSHDAAIISPAFERQDMRYLVKILHQELGGGDSVGFLMWVRISVLIRCVSY